jgi:glycosyltransferase involved in cell wall biosynthesis
MLVSIITINYNHIEGLKKTMNSVFEQSHSAIEYIVIDGGSKDGSADFIAEHSNKLTYRISETDDGIYHAMNKGIDQATGDYVLFLNSGDCLVDEFVIEKFEGFNPVEDLVYGDPLVRDGIAWQRKLMPKHMSIGVALTHTLAHQAEFYKRSLFNDNFRYDTSYKVVSDWILTNDAIIFKKCSSRYLDLVVCCFEDPGISSDFNLRHTERKRYLKENFDPLFLGLLKEYKLIQSQHETLKKSTLVQWSLWILQKKAKLIQYFKK